MDQARKEVYSEAQTMEIGYCIDRGRAIEKEIRKLHDAQNGKILDFDTQQSLKEKEDKLIKEAAKLKVKYREAIEARKKYDYHVEEALRLRERWGFK